MSADSIIDFLDDVFGGLKVDLKRDDALAADVFHVEVDTGIEMILAIEDAAIAAQSIADIQQAIETQAKNLMDSHQNTIILMTADLSCSVQ